MALQHNRLTQPEVALKRKPQLFSAAVLQGLREEAKAQEKAGPNLVSLDGDPFIGGDGRADRYVLKRTTIKDGKCWVEVHGVRQGTVSEAPEVTPELTVRDGQWVFANFYFPNASNPRAFNLLDQLKTNRELQRKYQTKADRK